MTRFVDRLWLAWKVLRGRVVDYRAGFESARVTFEFTTRERAALQQRLARGPERTIRRDGR